jgi:organic radical activating enzyme
LVFQPSRLITPCCINPARPGHPVLASFDSVNVSLGVALKTRAEIVERHKAGIVDPACQGCPRLEQADWPAVMSEYAVDEITLTPFTSCNIRCNYCYTVGEGALSAPLSSAPRALPIIQELIDRNLLDPHATIRFSGGEPTLSPEFEPLLERLTAYGARCIVYTNATKHSDAIMEALRRDKVELVLGVDAASGATYKAIKKMNYFDKVWKVVADYCAAERPDAANKVWVKFIFCAENYQEAEAFVSRAAAAGARHVYYDVDASRLPRRRREGLGPLPEEISEAIAVLRHECRKRGIEAEFSQVGLAWLTPERVERIDRAMERLNQAEAAFA